MTALEEAEVSYLKWMEEAHGIILPEWGNAERNSYRRIIKRCPKDHLAILRTYCFDENAFVRERHHPIALLEHNLLHYAGMTRQPPGSQKVRLPWDE